MAQDNATRAAIIKTFVVFGLLFYLVYNMAVQNTDELGQQVSQEINASKNLISTERWKTVISNTESSFNVLVKDYGLIEHLNQILIPDNSKPSRGINVVAEKFTSFNYTMAKNIPLLIFQSLYRWNLILGWLIIFLPYLFAMLADGMYQWKLKRYVFGNVTVQFYRVWFRAFWIISALTTVYLVMPNMALFNNFAQLFPPIALLLLGIALNRLWSNFQKLM
ncbi:DUF4400 domain-containing protein [Salmonella enterica]|nr:DUF4400 domain-containing protein [Salmonella enterica]EEX1005144.1 DUF4400 domain-containing protein [Escherichia coli]